MNFAVSTGFITLSCISICLFLTAKTQNEGYHFSQVGSKMTFEVSHMEFLTVQGQFDEFSGSLTGGDGIFSSIQTSIRVQSINTKDASRDDSLLDEGYLDASTYPEITFKSSEIDNSSRIIYGTLKIKDIEKKIKVPFSIANKKGATSSTLKATTNINRKYFEIDFGLMDDLVGDNIKVILELNLYPFRLKEQ